MTRRRPHRPHLKSPGGLTDSQHMESRVLVVDDEAHVVNVVAIKLRRAGIEVLTAMDGQEAIEVALEYRPDVIVTDYRMPLMNGLELCKRLRGMAETRDIPVILLTAHGHYIPEVDGAPEQIREVMAKPFSPRELLSKVKGLLAERKGRGADPTGQQAAAG